MAHNSHSNNNSINNGYHDTCSSIFNNAPTIANNSNTDYYDTGSSIYNSDLVDLADRLKKAERLLDWNRKQKE